MTVTLLIVLIGACTLSDEPLSAIQLIWAGVVFNTWAAFAFASMPPCGSELNGPPRSKPIVNEYMWRNIIGQILYQVAVLTVLTFTVVGLFGFEFERSDPLHVGALDIA